ncbi:hypothetical protein [Lysobacter arvi]|uniref:Uncharacterized protein n=1 Tax=Lysobacter arvi TaxID=3038776 RepID=A0ABU1CCU3_9GAMM|nr:hypothetical protein [Lysobacter arvi]MDR0181867.1 hypothetical protein [Lysobacter arvi]
MHELSVTDSQRSFLEDLGRTARAHLSHLDWDEVEPHLRLGWYSSVLSNDLDWGRVEAIAHESWARDPY